MNSMGVARRVADLDTATSYLSCLRCLSRDVFQELCSPQRGDSDEQLN